MDKRVENTDDDNLILTIMRNGLIDYKIFDNPKFNLKFEEKYIPNVMFSGVYIKKGYTYLLECLYSVLYDRTQRKIYFDVTTNKEEFRQGEEVVLNISAKDENNKPCVADVNISVVDEVYFAVFPKHIDTLVNLYEYILKDV